MSDLIGKIIDINGPIVKAVGMDEAGMFDLVYVGAKKLIGEIIRLDQGRATIQVYEDNSMMSIGEEVISHHRPLSVRLGPGLLQGIYDGIQRPLKELSEQAGDFLAAGVQSEPLNTEKKWHFEPSAKVGDTVHGGSRIGSLQETALIRHYIMTEPNQTETKIKSIVGEGDYTINDVIAELEDGTKVYMAHYWGVRYPRPYKTRLSMQTPLITGQRVIDMFFPISRGGTAAIPGGFGTGKTMTQHALAKWSDADIIVYIGCGERGNEMTDVLNEFPNLIDPRSGESLMNRTVLIANTSNMPVAAREVSIYTGITIAEYYRDMGYNVAIMADSTSRWAEALRELSGRLEEMPAEEGFPAYLPTRLASFYERAGFVSSLNGEEGSVSIIGAVSPPGGDFSEPVTQHTKRFVRCFWALDKSLANARHYPSISWLDSYSEYAEETRDYWHSVDSEILDVRAEAMNILKKEDKLAQIVKLVGPDSLPDNQKLILMTADIIKKGYLQQNAFDKVDMYSTLQKQSALLKVIISFYECANEALEAGAPLVRIRELGIDGEIVKLKSEVPNDQIQKLEEFKLAMKEKFGGLVKHYK
ncbi:MAG: V-type ATP synthase subunit A [Spirochaetales bacterium]|nr:V-type ATP synthase subunit A [Spirochaetales bacterium]